MSRRHAQVEIKEFGAVFLKKVFFFFFLFFVFCFLFFVFCFLFFVFCFLFFVFCFLFFCCVLLILLLIILILIYLFIQVSASPVYIIEDGHMDKKMKVGEDKVILKTGMIIWFVSQFFLLFSFLLLFFFLQ